MDIVLVSLLLFATLLLLVMEWLPVDLTSIGILVALMATGLLTPREALDGFAHPAPITVAALFIVSMGLARTGALDAISDRVLALSKGRSKRFLLICLLLVGILSAFVNNTPVVILFISIVVAFASRFQQSPSRFLLPISFMSILAGTCTLIGTSTNIVVSDLGVQLGQKPIGMFELASLGVPFALVGGVMLYFFAPRLLRSHKEPIAELREGEFHRYISEVRVPEDSPLVGHPPIEGVTATVPGIVVFEVIRDPEILDPAEDEIALRAGDLMLLKGTAGDLYELFESGQVVTPQGETGPLDKPYTQQSVIAELIVPPNSPLVDVPLRDTDICHDPDINILGVKRRHEHYSWQRASELTLAVGDILLVQGPTSHLDMLRLGEEVIVLDDVFKRIRHRQRAWLSAAIFMGMVVLAASGLVNILIAALGAAFLMLATGCLRLHTAYRALDPRVLLLIIGTIGLGRAIHQTGAADLYASYFLSPFAGASPHLILSAFILLTSILSHVLSNNSTAALLVPLALSTATALEVDPRPFLIGICFGASACYASPIGYQTNLLVLEPGGYRVGDYLRLGLPLNILVWFGSSLFIPLLWPF